MADSPRYPHPHASKGDLHEPLHRLLPPAQVAEVLGVTVQTLASWRSTNRYPLRFARIGRKIMYKAEDVQAFVEGRLFDHTSRRSEPDNE